jgi:hypothetical protein
VWAVYQDSRHYAVVLRGKVAWRRGGRVKVVGSDGESIVVPEKDVYASKEELCRALGADVVILGEEEGF